MLTKLLLKHQQVVIIIIRDIMELIIMAIDIMVTIGGDITITQQPRMQDMVIGTPVIQRTAIIIEDIEEGIIMDTDHIMEAVIIDLVTDQANHIGKKGNYEFNSKLS